MHVPDKYVWVTWSSAFLVPWLALFISFPRDRKVMIWASILTTPFGLIEPLFVPQYWNPPSLFDLAQKTGFDLESLIFCFAIGGVGSILYNVVTGQDLQPVSFEERESKRHRYNRASLVVPILTFPLLCLTRINPIYAAIGAIGGIATIACRPDLKVNTLIGGGLFAG